MNQPVRVLIVEDSDADTERLLLELRRGSFDPIHRRVETESGMRAVLHEVAWEIILCDYNMPGFSGLAVLDVVKQTGIDIPVVVLSDSAGEDLAVTAMQAGASDYLSKSNLGRLVPAVRRELREADSRRARGQAEQTIRRLAAIVASSSDAIISRSLDGTILDWNEGAETLYGWKAVEVLGKPLRSIMLADGCEAPAADLDRLQKEERLAPREAVHFRKDGTSILVSVNWSPIKDARGAIIGISSIARDITEQKRSEQQIVDQMRQLASSGNSLRNQTRIMESVLANMADGVVVADENGKLVIFNPAAEAIVGVGMTASSPGEWSDLYGVYLPDKETLFPPQDLPLARAMRGENVDQQELFIRNAKRAQGTWISVTASPLRNEAGGLYGGVVVIRDITERKQSEETRRRLAGERNALLERLQLHIEKMPLGYILQDSSLRITAWNPGAEKIFGWSRDQALGQPSSILFPSDVAEHTPAGLPGTTENITRTGERICCEWYDTMLRNEQGEITGYLSMVADITERSRIEEQYRQSQKMEAIGQLAGGIAHDFNNLLTIIAGYCDLLLARCPSADASRPMIEEIRKAGERSAGLARQLLAFSRNQVLAPRVLDLNAIIRDMENMLHRLIGEDITLTTCLDPDLALVSADASQIEQVIMNLAVNARDAMPRGGRLTIETGYYQQAVSSPDMPPGLYVALRVSDSGTGMSEETKARIFEPFFTTKEKSRGTGLGLATVHGIVKQSGGAIQVASEPGRGTIFHIFLPQVEDSLSPPLPETAHLAIVQGSETILLVEDEDEVRTLTAFVLQSWGYQVLTASDGKEAIQIVGQFHDPIHLLLTDVVMPEIGGRQLAEIILRTRPDTKILFLSGYTDDAIVRHGVSQAEVAFLQKPFTATGLAAKVREVLDGKVKSHVVAET